MLRHGPPLHHRAPSNHAQPPSLPPLRLLALTHPAPPAISLARQQVPLPHPQTRIPLALIHPFFPLDAASGAPRPAHQMSGQRPTEDSGRELASSSRQEGGAPPASLPSSLIPSLRQAPPRRCHALASPCPCVAASEPPFREHQRRRSLQSVFSLSLAFLMNYAYVTYIRRYKKEQEYGIQYNVKVKSSSSRAVITFDLRNPRRCQKKKKREHPPRTCNQPSFPNHSSPARARPGVTCPSALPEFLKPSCLLSTSS